MKLNHINLPVADVAASRDFFARYFGMKTAMELGRGVMAMMRDEGDMVLILSHFDKSAEIHYHKDFHVGFYLETREEVNNVRALMTSDGLDVEMPKQRQGRYGFYLQAPGGFTTEVAILEGTGGAP
jgi:catechol 2,3-dioxygenase-like lactoylglutathione lyase family enzyme